MKALRHDSPPGIDLLYLSAEVAEIYRAAPQSGLPLTTEPPHARGCRCEQPEAGRLGHRGADRFDGLDCVVAERVPEESAVEVEEDSPKEGVGRVGREKRREHLIVRQSPKQLRRG